MLANTLIKPAHAVSPYKRRVLEVFGLTKHPDHPKGPIGTPIVETIYRGLSHMNHRQHVVKLYKACMRNNTVEPQTYDDWLTSKFVKDVLNPSLNVREIFRNRKRETNPELIKVYIRQAYEFLVWSEANETQKRGYMRGGSLYERNSPFHEMVRTQEETND